MLSALLCVAAIGAAGQGKTFPRDKDGNIVIFEAGKDNPYNFLFDTGAWVEGGDCTPVPTLVTSDDGNKWLEIKYTGSKGVGRALMGWKDAITTMRRPDEQFTGLKLEIECSEPGNLTVHPLNPGAMAGKVLSLSKGVKEYVIKDIVGRKHGQLSWNLLSGLAIFRYAGKYDVESFRLKKILLLSEKQQSTVKELEITQVKKVQEVLQASSPDKNGGFNPGYDWSKCSKLEGFTYYKDASDVPANLVPKVRAGWADGKFFISNEAKFPDEPASMAELRDGLVWQDESIELLFSAENDNNLMIQYAVNAKGVAYDFEREYDVVAAMVMNRIQKDFSPMQSFSYADGVQNSRLMFSFEDLNIDMNKSRCIGFQFVQNYSKRREEQQLSMMRWSPAPLMRNTAPEGFGILVLNRKSFGAGNLKITNIRRYEHEQSSIYADFEIEAVSSGFKPGEYTVKHFITAGDNSIFTSEEKVTLGAEKNFKSMFNAKNVNGTYTWRIEVRNRAGDMKVAAVNFKNENDIVELFGEKLLWPRPKHVNWSKGVFNAGSNDSMSIPANASERTVRTAEIFAEKLLGFAGTKYHINKLPQTGAISLILKDEVEFSGKREKLKPEGYFVKVTPERVEITGKDEAGLFYGTATFMQLLNMSMKRLDTAPVPCVEILDWPDIDKRLGRFWPPTQLHSKVKDRWDADDMIEWIDRFVAGNKLNLLWLDITRGIIFERDVRNNYNKKNRQLTLGELKRIADFCRDRFIKLIPAVALGGHGEGRRIDAGFKDPVWKSTDNVANPEYFKWVEATALDIIEATGCEYFSPKLDEWWHTRNTDVEDTGIVYGKTRPQAMLDLLLELHGLLKKHHVKMVVYEDMLNPLHNGRRYDCHQIIDKLPRDIIISCWSWRGGFAQVAAYFGEKGFEVWGNETGFQRLPVEARKLHKGFGVGLYAAFGTGLESTRRPSYNYLGQWFVGADYAWNFLQDSEENKRSLEDELNNGILPELHSLFSLKPNPFAAEHIQALNISSAMNIAVNDKKIKRDNADLELPHGEKNIGNIPTLFALDKNNCILVAQGDKIKLPIKGRFSSLIFLQSGLPPDNHLKVMRGVPFSFRSWQKGWVFGTYSIKYASGKEVHAKVRIGAELYWLDMRPRDGGCINTRYVLPLKRKDGKYAFLYQWEWVNPYPFDDITEVVFNDETDMPLETLIFAVSGRLPRKTVE